MEQVTVLVVAAARSPVLAVLVTQRLAGPTGCEVAATADSVDELREVLAANPADVLVVDLALAAGASGDVCDVLADLHPLNRTVGLIPPGRSRAALAVRGDRVGLGGLLVADDDLGDGHLAYVVRQMAVGRRCYGPAVQELLRAPPARKPGPKPVDGLTPRDREIAELAAQDLSRTEIAERLVLAPDTVKWYLRRVRDKLGVADPYSVGLLRRRLEEHDDPDNDLAEG